MWGSIGAWGEVWECVGVGEVRKCVDGGRGCGKMLGEVYGV